MKADWVGVQKTDPSPIVYLSGGICSARGRDGLEQAYEEADPYAICVSYLYIKEESNCRSGLAAEMEIATRRGVRIFVDSGAFTFQIQGRHPTDGKVPLEAQVEAYAKRYVAWIKQYPPGTFDFYVTLDYRTHCPTIYKMTKHLYALGIRPIPVYHGDMGTEWMQRYVDDGHTFIGIGLNKTTTIPTGEHRRRFYDRCFDFSTKAGISLHGFMCTGSDMFAYPWYSCDSASWIKTAGMGGILAFDQTHTGKVKARVQYLSRRGLPDYVKPLEHVREQIAALGYTIEELQDSRYKRSIYNIKALQQAAGGMKMTMRNSKWKGTLC